MSRFYTTLRAIASAIPFAVLAACGDPTGPTNASPGMEAGGPRSLLGLNPLSKHAVEWSRTHTPGTYSASKIIGSGGGSISIPQSDFTVTFAPGAVSSPTAITITSLEGPYVTYDMRPHGLRFRARVTATQGLKNTEARSFDLLKALTLVGAYVDNDVPPGPDGSFIATEILESTTYFVRSLLGVLSNLIVPDRSVWELKHFSRYMLASG